MEYVNNKDIILYFLKKDYKFLSNIIINLSNHINRLYDNFIITTDERKRINIMLSDTINKLNDYYNLTSGKLFNNNDNDNDNNNDNDNDNDNDNFNKQYKIRKTEINFIYEIIESIRDTDTVNIFYPEVELIDFKNILDDIKKISGLIGLNNINDILKIYNLNIDFLKINNDHNNKFNILKEIFVPISINYTSDKRIDKKNNIFEFIQNDFDDRYSLMLGNIFQLKIRFSQTKTVLHINGYIDFDSVNGIIRTSQICNDYLYNIKTNIINEIEKIKDVDENFKQSYIRNLSVGELLLFDPNIRKKKISDDYIKFLKYTNMNFKSIMNDFIHSDLYIKYEIIRFLLLGSSTSINIAGLLFGITKDHKESIDNNSKPTLISDIIYKNLKFISQNKLKKYDTIINLELEKINSININDIDLKKQILINKSMPDHIKKIALNKLEEINKGSSENYKHIDYVKSLIDYPWISNDYSDIFSILNNNIDDAINFINQSRNNMNNIIFGHDKCKDIIIELIAKWITNPKSIGKCIGLMGPPGVGKTLFGKALGDILNIPFAQINVGGVDDASVLSGHSFTYSNAQPGLIVRKMIQAGAPRCIVFIDEVDKTGAKYGINEIMNVLIHITDPNTNDNFNDKFFQEVTFPLSKVLFIFSYNDQSKIDKILLDRIEQINVEAYTASEKVKIFKSHLLHEITSDINIPYDLCKFNDEVIEYLIETYTYESGVRGLKRKLEKIILKLNLDRIYKRGIFEKQTNNIVITTEIIDTILEKSNIIIKKILPKSHVGIINGLYATDSGSGGILPILIYRNCNGTNKFKLKLTGSQKSVMQESIEFSFTIATNLLKPEVINKFIKNNPDGLHIHTPDGATPKDGPSAGSAFTTAFISKILNIPIKNNIAMTGEIETNGMITAIGGLDSKLNGAKKAGVELVLIPKENEKDYEKIIKKNPKLIDNKFKVIIVNDIYDVVEYALIDSNNTKFNVNDKTFRCKDYFCV
jgi:endopeptidase La